MNTKFRNSMVRSCVPILKVNAVWTFQANDNVEHRTAKLITKTPLFKYIENFTSKI